MRRKETMLWFCWFLFIFLVGCSGGGSGSGGNNAPVIRPEVISITPSDGANAEGNGIITITFSEDVIYADVLQAIVVTNNSGQDLSGVSLYNNRVLTFTPDKAFQPGQYYVRILAAKVINNSGNAMLKDFLSSFNVLQGSVDIIAPKINIISPSDGSSNISAGALIQVTFSEDVMSPDVLEALILTDDHGHEVAGTAVYNSQILLFTPSSNLLAGEKYHVRILAGKVIDGSDNEMAGDFLSSFTVVQIIADTIPPQVIKVLPADKSVRISPTSKIVINFSEDIRSANILAVNPLKNNAGNSVEGAGSYNSETATYIFTPSNSLVKGENYAISIPSNAVIDLAGNQMVDNFSSTFTVEPELSPDKYVRLVSAKLLPDYRWEYNLELWKEAIPATGLLTNPFIAGDFNSWNIENITDFNKDGYYEAKIVTFNKYINFNYGGDHDSNSWADVGGSIYFNKDKGTLLIGFCNGSIYIYGRAPFGNSPGVNGDNWLRYDIVEGKVVIYLNNNYIAGSIAKPFVRGNFTSWSPGDQIIYDSSGWGKFETERDRPTTLELNYGGDYASNSYADMAGSSYYDSVKQILVLSVP